MRSLGFPTRYMRTFMFFLISAFLGAVLYAGVTQKSTLQTLDPLIVAPDFHRELASELEELTRQLISTTEKVSPHILIRLNSVISRLDPRYALSDKDLVNATEESSEVCAEDYNKNGGWPFFQNNFHQSSSCDTESKPPFDSLITILLDFTHVSNASDIYDLSNTLKGVWEYNVGIKVLLGLSKVMKHSEPIIKLLYVYPNVEAIFVGSEYSEQPGNIWNILTSNTHTPYVLIGRDLIHFSSYSSLERQIHVLSTADNVIVVGGSSRNRTGHWRAGCLQSELKNYKLKYIQGYRYSAKDCMICDSVQGPFVTRTELIQKIPFSNVLSKDLVFENWFLHMKHFDLLMMVCPDVMYFTGTHVKSFDSKAFLLLAREWEVYHVTLYTGQVFSYSCEDIGLSCDAMKLTKSFLLPGCCLPEIYRVFKAFDDFARNHSLKYELDAGSLLGAVKINGFMPWDIDGDMTFDGKDYLTYYKNRKWFLEQGISMDSFSLSYNGQLGFFKLYAYQIFIEMYGAKNMSSSLLPESMQDVPTLVNVLGIWMMGQANPGLYSRNRYGPNFLKHSHSWRYLDMDSSFVTYKAAGTWRKCPQQYHHACLNHFPGDGNLDFFPP